MMRSATAIASTSRDSRFAKTNPNGFISDYDAAGIGIDLDLGDLAAVGEVFRNAAPNLHSRRQPKNQTSPSMTVTCRQHAPSQPGRSMTADENPINRTQAAYSGAAAETPIVSAARIRLDPRKSVRSFKGIICGDISEFESYMLSHAVGSL